MERYNYVDPDYAYTEEEEKLKQGHKDHYTDYIKHRREQRLKEKKDRYNSFVISSALCFGDDILQAFHSTYLLHFC